MGIGCGCGSVGRAVASNTRGLQFKSSHRQNLYCTLLTVNCIEKTKNKEKRGREWPTLKNNDGLFRKTTNMDDLGQCFAFSSFMSFFGTLLFLQNNNKKAQPVRPDWANYWTWSNHSKPLATINLPKSPTLLGNLCKGVKIYHFSIEIIFGQLL